MKKGLLSILAGALVVVGCQNYDDQFDSLESQINALASTVAGLSQVQSDLASLSGTVASLASTVNGLGSQIDTAVANGLADIQADIDAIETAVADVASSEEVSALSDAVAASQEDLDELLANSSVYQGAITINSPSTLDVYHQMGSAIAIVNESVTITMKTTMDETKMQEVIDQILVTTGDFSYTSEASSIAEMTFNNLSGTQSLTVEQAGGYQFQGLGSATVIDLGDAFKSSVTKVDFRELTSVTRFETENVANEIRFTKAVECHLTKLVYYPGSTLTIVLDEGAALPLALDDVDGNGDQTNKTLSITGPDSVTIENWTDGTLSFTDVKTVVVNGFEGTINANGGVESLTADKYAIAGTLGADLETINLTGITDPDVTTDTTGPAFSLNDQTNVETITLAGKFASVNVEGCSNLTDAVISADVAGAIVLGDDTAVADGNSDLSTITLTGAKATSLEVSNNADLESLTVDLTFRAGSATGAKLNGALTVKDNSSLETLTVSSDKIEDLTVTGNDDLTTIDFTGLATFGADGEPTVNIYDNDLTASAAVDDEDTTATADGAAATDLGSFTTNSGMATLKTYLTAVAADSDANAAVWFDTVESYTNESDTESTDLTYANSDAGAKVLVLSPETTAAKGATKAKIGYKIPDPADGDRFQVYINGQRLLQGSSDQTYTSNTLTLSGNNDIDVSRIKDAVHLTNATANDVTLNAYVGGNDTVTVSLIAHANTTGGAAYTSGERYSTAAALSGAASAADQASFDRGGIGTDDIITLTVGTNVVTATAAHAVNSAITAQVSVISSALMSAWASKYGVNGTNSLTAVASITTANVNQIVVEGLDPGLRGDQITVSFSIANSTTGPTSVSANGALLDHLIGATRASADNKTDSNDIIVTVESNVAGTVLNKVKTNATGAGAGNYGVSYAGFTPVTLTASGYTVNSTDIYAKYQQKQVESRSDVRPAEDGTSGSGDAESFSRVHWLGS